MEYRHARSLVGYGWYEWETNKWYIEEQDIPEVEGGNKCAQQRNTMRDPNLAEEIEKKAQRVPAPEN